MPYLTYQEYIDYGFDVIPDDEFNRLLPRASDLIDSITRSFYRFNEIIDDVEFRRVQFKKAVGSQIQHFNEVGASSHYGMRDPQSVTIGRTSMSNGSSNSQKVEVSLVSNGAINYLVDTGLLYRGLS